MTDIFTPEKRSEIMRRIRGAGTKSELELRRLFDKLGVEYVYQAKVGRWRVDFLIPDLRLIVEYRSCFWHPHKGCRLSKFPKSNQGYWIPKLQRNAERDMRKDAELTRLGFKVFVIRDCDRKIKVKELEELIRVGSDGRWVA
jgi:DNA mismatch endonuclease (patch repair protein)